MPVNNAAFWLKKIAQNRRRDLEVNRVLRAKGWHVLRIWEHELTAAEEGRLIKRVKLRLVTSRISRFGSRLGSVGGRG